MTRIRTLSRRTVLRLASSAIVTSLLAGCSSVIPSVNTELIELGAAPSGWEGRRPANIKGEINPTVELTTGTTCALTWKNTDGKNHKFIITDDSGMELESTESTKTQGATQTVAFTAEPTRVSYHDTYHPESMRGEIRVNPTSAL